jgi:hypothetical protein
MSKNSMFIRSMVLSTFTSVNAPVPIGAVGSYTHSHTDDPAPYASAAGLIEKLRELSNAGLGVIESQHMYRSVSRGYVVMPLNSTAPIPMSTANARL